MFIRNAGTQVAAIAPLDKVVTSAANVSGVITVAAVEARRHLLHKLVWSYSGAPTGGRVTITGGDNSLDIDITNSGPGSLSINYICSENTALVVTIFAAGIGVVGKLYIEHILEP